ncbi:MAG: ATP-dependent helicase RhlE [Tepidiphilus sp.]|nr:ATP-dependent helicase RhlE [Tepidiphilus sp.]
MTFSELGLLPELLAAVNDLGYTEPTPIQAQAIPRILAGKDLLGAAQTGTGKTAGFTLPLLQRLAPHANTSASPARHPVRALVLAPTRELVLQVYESVRQYGKYLPLRAAAIYGGVDIKPQIEELRRGVEIVVATPGRLLDHLEQKTIQLNQVEFLVFDEADRMLDMGFMPDIRRIMERLPRERQTVLFSATFSPEIKKLAQQLLHEPETIEVARRNTVSETITHRVVRCEAAHKRDALVELLQRHPGQALVFVDTKIACGRLASLLQRRGIQAEAIHGDKSQQQRFEVLEAFKNGSLRVLVATDVAARGLDIEELPFVINYALPSNPEDYVHRVGRTGRAGHEGLAISLVDASEEERLQAIEKMLGRPIPAETLEPPPRERRAEPARRRTERSGRAPDGFDFSRPYEPKAGAALATTKQQPEARRAGSKKAVAVLLGGSGRAQ